MTTIRVETYGVVTEEPRDTGPGFWLLLAFGVGWLLLSYFVLQFTYESIASISILIGILLLLGAANELVSAFLVPGWRWAHVVLGVLFAFGGIFAVVYPGQTFGTLAVLFGWYLVLKGTFDIVMGLMVHGAHLWWLSLVAGVAEIALAFWCIGYPGRSAAMLVLWVGIGAALRGIATLVAAFRLRSASTSGAV
jgi:uncharacterized membrane protein HdeD (DUF308 family)